MSKKKENKEPKQYKAIEKQPQVVGEPMVSYSYGTRNTEEYLEEIPEDTMRMLIDIAMDDFKSGRCIPNSQIYAQIKEKMGWK